MSGIAIVIPGADFSGKNLGKVTFLEDIDVTGIAIVANDSYEGQTAQLSIAYTPATTNQKGATWSITEGGAYASINPSTGKLTILSGANNSAVTVKAVSNFNASIVATKDIHITYKETVDELTGISIVNESVISGQSVQLSVAYTPANSSYTGVAWSITEGSAYASIDSSTGRLTILSGANNSPVTVNAVSVHNPSISTNKKFTVTFMEQGLLYKLPEPYKGAAATGVYLDTGIKLFSSNRPFTMIFKVYSKNPSMLNAAQYKPIPYISLGNNIILVALQEPSVQRLTIKCDDYYFQSSIVENEYNQSVFAVSHDSSNVKIYQSYNGEFKMISSGNSGGLVSDSNMILCAREMDDGTINYNSSTEVKTLNIYDSVLTEEEIQLKIAAL